MNISPHPTQRDYMFVSRSLFFISLAVNYQIFNGMYRMRLLVFQSFKVKVLSRFSQRYFVSLCFCSQVPDYCNLITCLRRCRQYLCSVSVQKQWERERELTEGTTQAPYSYLAFISHTHTQLHTPVKSECLRCLWLFWQNTAFLCTKRQLTPAGFQVQFPVQRWGLSKASSVSIWRLWFASILFVSNTHYIIEACGPFAIELKQKAPRTPQSMAGVTPN